MIKSQSQTPHRVPSQFKIFIMHLNKALFFFHEKIKQIFH
jgi:hypothetical protein